MRRDSGLDIGRLQRYLSQTVPDIGTIQSAEKFSDGQSNPTYRLHCENQDYVLRSKPAGKLLKSAHAVEREFRVMDALAGSQVPVPAMFHLCEDVSVVGSVFFIISHENGSIFLSLIHI